nr:MAG TPA: hypothetical protein [Caudoviricetes sp.]
MVVRLSLALNVSLYVLTIKNNLLVILYSLHILDIFLI